MLPYKSLLRLESESKLPKYLQITNEFIKNISSGKITGGTKLPGSRQLAELIGVNRRTVIAAFDELMAQGWVNIVPNQGCFVSEQIPEIKPKGITDKPARKETKKTAFPLNDQYDLPTVVTGDYVNRQLLKIDDGYPDVRIAPLKELSRNLSYIMNTSLAGALMNYRQAYMGDLLLRQELVKYLAETRSINNIGVANILITRGSLMAFYLLFKAILSEGDEVIAGYPGWGEGYNTVKLAKGKLTFVPVDRDGIEIDHIEEICQKRKIRAVFTIPHHHYPTTVSLSASRRMKLLMLAQKYEFAIVEDDYDYDYHYASSPVLPMASSDYAGSVAYVGSFSKTLAPSLRVGFIVAPEELIDEVAKVSRYTDSHGNIALERAIAMLLREGEIRRHMKKALRTYRERRAVLLDFMNSELLNQFQFDPPEGGMALWARLDPNLSLSDLVQSCEQKGLIVAEGNGFGDRADHLNALRIGFASKTEPELLEVLELLKKGINRLTA